MREDFFEIMEHSGLDYSSALAALHRKLRPSTYMEIGTLFGTTLALANCASVAVDPTFSINGDVIGAKPACLLFQMTSDDFFANHDPKTLLGGTIELAFLDGMHLFEFLLRDFMNTERSCARGSIILMHDCLPPDSYVARRNWQDRTYADVTKHPEWWTGDVWKTVYILQEWRPELEIHALNSVPTGLIAVTNLNPDSTVLSGRYDELVKEHASIELHAAIERYLNRLKIIDTAHYVEHLAKPFH